MKLSVCTIVAVLSAVSLADPAGGARKSHRGENYRGGDYRGENYRGGDYRSENYRGGDYRGENYRDGAYLDKGYREAIDAHPKLREEQYAKFVREEPPMRGTVRKTPAGAGSEDFRRKMTFFQDLEREDHDDSRQKRTFQSSGKGPRRGAADRSEPQHTAPVDDIEETLVYVPRARPVRPADNAPVQKAPEMPSRAAKPNQKKKRPVQREPTPAPWAKKAPVGETGWAGDPRRSKKTSRRK